MSRLKYIEHMPPSGDALNQQFLRVAYHSGNVWDNYLDKFQDPVSPTSSGWQQESLYSMSTLDHTMHGSRKFCQRGSNTVTDNVFCSCFLVDGMERRTKFH